MTRGLRLHWPILFLGAFAGLVAAYNHHVIAVHNQKLEHRAAPATNRAATERAQDTIAETNHAEEMHNAIHSVPDAPGLAMLLLASACTTTGAIPPPVDDLKAAVAPKPVPGDDIATSDQANADYNAAIESWGDGLFDAGGRLCRWVEAVYNIRVGCPARPPQVIDAR